tara:strand:- start:1040 stop:1402 length:363 start_codon:yes stop_codon:yes gene_type:complete
MVCRTEVLVGVSNMAELMANSDLAIGAAGATSWERCCLGLPSLMVVLADNQLFAAELLKEAGAALTLPVDETLPTNLNRVLVELSQKKLLLKALGDNASEITDGNGCERVADILAEEVFK